MTAPGKRLPIQGVMVVYSKHADTDVPPRSFEYFHRGEKPLSEADVWASDPETFAAAEPGDWLQVDPLPEATVRAMQLLDERAASGNAEAQSLIDNLLTDSLKALRNPPIWPANQLLQRSLEFGTAEVVRQGHLRIRSRPADEAASLRGAVFNRDRQGHPLVLWLPRTPEYEAQASALQLDRQWAFRNARQEALVIPCLQQESPDVIVEIQASEAVPSEALASTAEV